MRVFLRSVLLAACLLALSINSVYAERTEGFRLGAGGGVFQMWAKVPNDNNTYKAFLPGYVARVGYAFSPSWELGAMVSGGGSRTDVQGVRTVKLKMPPLPQAYLLGRFYLSDNVGLYGMLTAGALKEESLNAANQVIDSRRSFALGAGAGVFWDVSDHYTIDVGGFMPGIRLSNTNSALKTYTPGLVATLSYAFGESDGRASVVREQAIEPVVRLETPRPEQENETQKQISPEPKVEPAPPPASEILLQALVFKPYSSELSPAAKAVLDSAIEQLKQHPNPNMAIEVAAHSDISGDSDENLYLSQMRAKGVKNYLAQHGVDASRISATGYGDTRPRYDNTTAEGRAKNRRVELRLIE